MDSEPPLHVVHIMARGPIYVWYGLAVAAEYAHKKLINKALKMGSSLPRCHPALCGALSPQFGANAEACCPQEGVQGTGC